MASPATLAPATPGVKAALNSQGASANDRRPAVMQLLDVVLRRCSDKAASVRTRALSSLATVLAPSDVGCPYLSLLPSLLLQLCHEHVALTALGGDGDANATMFMPGTTSRRASGASMCLSSSALLTPSPSGPSQGRTRGVAASPASGAVAQSALMALLLRRLGDTKPGVRKLALHCLAALALNVAAYRDLTTLDMEAACFEQAVVPTRTLGGGGEGDFASSATVRPFRVPLLRTCSSPHAVRFCACAVLLLVPMCGWLCVSCPCVCASPASDHL